MRKHEKIKNKITKDTTLDEILKFPKAGNILAKYNLPCLHCPMAALEMNMLRIGEVAKMYGIDIKNLLKELNKNIKVRK